MRTFLWILIGALLGVALLPYVLFRQQKMPAGTNLWSPRFEFSQARLLIDRTVWDSDAEQPVLSHQIFDAILAEIEGAESFVIADFFFGTHGAERSNLRTRYAPWPKSWLMRSSGNVFKVRISRSS